jgi:hypothetical protein
MICLGSARLLDVVGRNAAKTGSLKGTNASRHPLRLFTSSRTYEDNDIRGIEIMLQYELEFNQPNKPFLTIPYER